MEHIAIPAGERHPPHNWIFADATARLAASVTSQDVDCVALQLDTHDYWRLVSFAPAAWARINGGASGGGGDLTYVHEQTSASAVWTINHNLGKRPSITLVDSAGDEVEGAVNHASTVQTVVTFSAALSGAAYCN